MDSTPMARLARSDDAPAVVALWRRFMREEEAAVPRPEVEAAEPRWTRRLERQIAAGKCVVLARRDRQPDRLVGFAGFLDREDRHVLPPEVAWLVDLYVEPEARSHQAAWALFAGVVEAAGAYRAIWTNTHVRNRRAQILLRRVGFLPLDPVCLPGLRDQVTLAWERPVIPESDLAGRETRA